jgi:16S rRNA (uracil1498-N3)-methyltransferase
VNHKFIFYLDPDGISKESAIFSPEESHHLSGVLRKVAGCEVEAVDGCGYRYRIQLLHKKDQRWVGAILSGEKVEQSAPQPLWLALPCLKSERWEMALEGACELGIQGIYLTHYQNAAASWTTNRIIKARRKAIEALKQSGGSCLTGIIGPLSIQELLIANPSLNVYLADSSGPAMVNLQVPALLLIGPEAGIHVEEEALLKQVNHYRFNLGKRRLRSEIACVAALAQAALITSQT